MRLELDAGRDLVMRLDDEHEHGVGLRKNRDFEGTLIFVGNRINRNGSRSSNNFTWQSKQSSNNFNTLNLI
jgi:hypothetical protein